MVDRSVIRRKFGLLTRTMTERGRRLWVGAEADAIGYGGVAAVAAATGMAISTVRKGRDEVRAGALPSDVVHDRRPGGGRRRLEVKDPGILPTLISLVDPTTRGDPESPLRWTCKSVRTLARELKEAKHPVSPQKVGLLLNGAGYSLQGTSRVKEGTDHPDRNAQFEFINERAKDFIARGVPVISVDTKKKENVGNYSNAGREWQPKGQAVEVLTYDFPDLSMPKAIPYGVYDVASNSAYVNVGTDHDTPTFAVRSIETWWKKMGSVRYPGATEVFITADGGGSNSIRAHAWKAQLQLMADRCGLTLHVSHFPPGTSKWNKIEHRLFSFITLNWRGRPLTTYETVVALIASTTTTAGLRVTAELDEAKYPLGTKVPKLVQRGFALERASFHGDWNYTLRPRSAERLAELSGEVEPPRRPIKRRLQWQAIVQEQICSGLSAPEFCRRKGMSYNSFHSARRTIVGIILRPRRAK